MSSPKAAQGGCRRGGGGTLDACTHSKTVNRPWEAILQTILQTCHWSNLQNGLPHRLDVLQGPGQVSQGCMQRRPCMREQSGLCTVGGVGCTRCSHAAVEGVGHAFAQASMQAMSATWPKSIFVVCCEWCRAAPRLRASCCPQRRPTSRGPPRPIRTWSTGCFGLHATSGHSAVGGRRDLPRRWSQQVWVAAFTADRAPSKRQTLPHRWR